MKSAKYILLSYFINKNTPVYGSTPAPSITPYTKISKGASSNTFTIRVHNHTGTHVDAPAHFIEGGRMISEYSLEELIFLKPVLINCKSRVSDFVPLKESIERNEKAKNADILLLKTGFGRSRGSEVYRSKNPVIKSRDILWLRKKYRSVRAVGVDMISISSIANRMEGRSAHRAAFKKERSLGEPLLIIEDMNLLELGKSDLIKKIIVVPWNVGNIDSAPCSVLAEIETAGKVA